MEDELRDVTLQQELNLLLQREQQDFEAASNIQKEEYIKIKEYARQANARISPLSDNCRGDIVGGRFVPQKFAAT